MVFGIIALTTLIYIILTVASYVKKSLVVLVLIFMPWAVLAYPTIPTVQGSLCSPEDKDFKEYRYAEGIAVCERNVASARKDKICKRDGVFDRKDFTIDHILPLSTGGSNHDDNLWCQHKSINVTQQEYEVYLKLRDGVITQAEAIQYILDLKFRRLGEL